MTKDTGIGMVLEWPEDHGEKEGASFADFIVYWVRGATEITLPHADGTMCRIPVLWLPMELVRASIDNEQTSDAEVVKALLTPSAHARGQDVQDNVPRLVVS